MKNAAKALFLILALFGAVCCVRTGRNLPAAGEQAGETEAGGESGAQSELPALSVAEAVRLPEGSGGLSMVLTEGNYRVAGVPGFGENALAAIAGRYRVSPAAGCEIAVWLTREVLYYEGWQVRTTASTEEFPVMENGPLIAARFNEAWTAVFDFSGAGELSQNDIDRVIGIYRTRFMYFLTLASRDSDISLPASMDF
jgi:hypothetical protein